jgi:hypothetical protein
MKKFTVLTVGVFISFTSYCQLLTESFDNIATLEGDGWTLINASMTTGTTGWFQGKPSVFHSYAGTPKQYIVSEFNNLSNTNTISNWLITPVISMDNGYTIMFYTRKRSSNPFPDRLQVRLSDAGASSIDPSDHTDVGTYTNLLLEINPTQTPGNYPPNWTLQNVNVSGLSGLTNVRIGFRYYVADEGPNGSNPNYIGIDEVSVSSTLSLDYASMMDLKYVFNKDSKLLTLESKFALNKIQINNLLGQEVLVSKLGGTYNEVNLNSVKTGIYLANIEATGFLNKTIKLIVY